MRSLPIANSGYALKDVLNEGSNAGSGLGEALLAGSSDPPALARRWVCARRLCSATRDNAGCTTGERVHLRPVSAAFAALPLLRAVGNPRLALASWVAAPLPDGALLSAATGADRSPSSGRRAAGEGREGTGPRCPRRRQAYGGHRQRWPPRGPGRRGGSTEGLTVGPSTTRPPAPGPRSPAARGPPSSWT